MGWSEMRCDVIQQTKLKQSDEAKYQCYGDNASINVKPEGGGGGGPRAYLGHLTFQKNFWSKSPPWGPKIGSNQIKYPHLFHQFILRMSSENSVFV